MINTFNIAFVNGVSWIDLLDSVEVLIGDSRANGSTLVFLRFGCDQLLGFQLSFRFFKLWVQSILVLGYLS